MRRPYAYLRKSRVFRDRNAISPEMQLAEVEALAARHGDSGLTVLQDMNVSGKKGRAGRPGFRQLLEAVEAGEVSAIYSYSLSRLSRSMRDVIDLAELCGARGVPIRLAVDPDPDPTSPSGKLILTILAAMAQFEADVASERARDTVEARRARGEKLGGKFFEQTDEVVRAYEAAGSIAGAAKLLTLKGVPTRNGNRIWQATAVRAILLRVAPELLPASQSRGVKKQAPFLFYRLLRCACGKTLTGVRYISGPQRGYVTYRCLQGRFDPLHHRQSVPESVVLAWAQDEAALLRPPVDLIQLAEDTAGKQNALRERKVRLGRAFVDGVLEPAEYEAEKARLERELAELEAQGRAVRLEPISWDRDPEIVNQALRAIWSHVQMGTDQRPVFAHWILPEWRQEELPAA